MEFSDIVKIIRDDLVETEKKLDESVKSDVPLVYEISKYLLGGGGKRVRPSLVLLSSGACGLTEGNNRIASAAAVELLHTATLLHDDVVDNGKLRRGNPSSNEVWGNAPTVLVGDFMLAQSINLVQECGSIELVGVVTKAASRLAEGHILEIMSERKMIETSEDACLSIIDHKTAALIECSVETGALLANVSDSLVRTLSLYGHNVGMAFQLIDDALDYCPEENGVGKKTGQDLAERKMTLPLFYSMEKAPEHTRRRIVSTLDREEELNSSELAEITEIVSRYGGVELTRRRAKEFTVYAKKLLEPVAESEYKKSLNHLADYVVDRDS